MSTVSRKCNELRERLKSFDGISDKEIFKKLIKISIEIYKIEKYVKEEYE